MYKFLRKLDNRRTASALFVVVVGIAFYMALSNISAIRTALSDFFYYISPFVSGVILAYILQPIYVFFNKYVFAKMKNGRLSHALSVILTVVSALAIVTLILASVIPDLIDSIKVLVKDINIYTASLSNMLNNLNERIPYFDIDADSLVNMLKTAVDKVADWVLKNITDILNASYKLGSGVVNTIVAFIISIYVLASQKNLLKAGKRLCLAIFKPETYKVVSELAKKSNAILKGYIGGNILDAVIIGVANLIFMTICGMPNSGLISIIVGVTNLIPTFGPFIGAIPSVLILLIFEPRAVLWFVIFTLILQQMDGNVIKPLVFGDAAGIAPIWVLVSIIVFGRMFGLVGMLLGVPLFAILRLVYDYSISNRFKHKGISDPYEADRLQPKKPSGLARFKAKIKELLERKKVGASDDTK